MIDMDIKLKRNRPKVISQKDVYCLRAFVLEFRTLADIGADLVPPVSPQRVAQRLDKFGVRRGRGHAYIGKPELADPYLIPQEVEREA